MNTKHTKLALVFTLLFSCLHLRAAEQDNWYLAKSIPGTSGDGIAYHEDNATGEGKVYAIMNGGSSAYIGVFDLNGTWDRNVTIANSRYYPRDLALDENGTIYIAENSAVTCLENNGTFRWRTGKNASLSNYGSSGSGDGEFSDVFGIALGADGKVYVADYSNHRVQVLENNGSFVRSFGSYGTAPGQFRHPGDLVVLENGTVVVADQYYLHFFQPDGTFIRRTSSGENFVSLAKDGTLASDRRLLDQDGTILRNIYGVIDQDYRRTAFTSSGDLIVNTGTLKVYKRAYRTKGLPVPNVIPQPAIRGISQRPGTNIIDLDFEIIDPDDANATVGFLAAVNGNFGSLSDWIIPSYLIDSTGSLIGTPIATNQVHRISWNVAEDWTQSTGTLKFEVLCQDWRRRVSPVDLHFLELPLAEGNLTISRSPLVSADFLNYFKFRLASGQSNINLVNGTIQKSDGTVLYSGSSVTTAGRTFFMDDLGYRWAKTVELSLAKEGATPGSINSWAAANPVQPRNLPSSVNELGFDTGNYSGGYHDPYTGQYLYNSGGWWVVKSSSLGLPDFTPTDLDYNGSSYDNFGSSAAAQGDKLAVALSTNKKKVFLYDVNPATGALQGAGEAVPDSTGNDSQGFGNSLALSGPSLLVGASQAYAPSYSTGAAYLYDLTGTPSQVARLTASDGSSNDYFGGSVAMDGNLMIVGAYGDDVDGNQSAGSAYVFKRTGATVTQVVKVTDSQGKSNDSFGASVSMDNGFVAVGAHGAEGTYNSQTYQDNGRVIVYKSDANGNLTETAILEGLLSNRANHHQNFGSKVSLSGNFLAVGGNNQIWLYKLSAGGTATPTSTLNVYPSFLELSGDRLLAGNNVYKVSAEGLPTLLETFVHPVNEYSGFNSGAMAGRNTVLGTSGFHLPGKPNVGSAILFRSSQ